MMEESLTQWLLAEPTITGIVGNSLAWNFRPEDDGYPALSISFVAGLKDYTHDGSSDLQYDRIQFDCFGESYAEAKLLSRAVIAKMEQSSNGPISGVLFEGSFVNSSIDSRADPLPSGKVIFGVIVDMKVAHKS